MLPIDLVSAEISRLGLRAEPPLEMHPSRPKSAKWILIEGRRCQVIPTTQATRCSLLYVPRTAWPDFLVYVAMPRSPNNTQAFYIVPRGALSADTTRAPDSSFLQKYLNGWEQLREKQDSRALLRRTKVLSAALKSVVMEARSRNLSVKLLRKANRSRLPLIFQHRVFIDGVRCTVMSATRIAGRTVIVLRRPVTNWGLFVIYVVIEPGTRSKMFVIPSREVQRTTSRSMNSEWLKPYLDAWGLLAAYRPAG